MASVNDKLERVRKPRVHIKYDVETENGVVEKELPFSIGVMGDFTGNNPSHAKKSLKDRKFINIDKENFSDVMRRLGPGVSLRVDNTLEEEQTEMAVNLQFNSMEDFEPANLVQQVPALKRLMDTRNKLRDLLTKADRSPQLEALLEKALQDPALLNQLSEELEKEANA